MEPKSYPNQSALRERERSQRQEAKRLKKERRRASKRDGLPYDAQLPAWARKKQER